MQRNRIAFVIFTIVASIMPMPSVPFATGGVFDPVMTTFDIDQRISVAPMMDCNRSAGITAAYAITGANLSQAAFAMSAKLAASPQLYFPKVH
jgi:hypothetical protein